MDFSNPALLNPAILAGVGIGAILVIGFFVWLFWPAGGCDHDCTEARYLADRSYPQRRWVHGVLAIYRGDAGDPAYWDAECVGAQTSGWSLKGPADLQKLLHRYHEGEINLAFDKARLIWLARLGQGAGWLSEQDSWQWCESAAHALRAHYGDWTAFQRDNEVGRAAWYDGSPPPEQLVQAAKNFQFAQTKILPQVAFR